MDAATLRTVQDVFASLHTPVRLLARSGQSLLPADGEAFMCRSICLKQDMWNSPAICLRPLPAAAMLTVRRSAAAGDTLLLARAGGLCCKCRYRQPDNALRMLLSKGLSPADVQALRQNIICRWICRAWCLLHMVRTGPAKPMTPLRPGAAG